ncbi:cysteine-S-conjugate beta-lyase [Malassezia equina]|uniref:Cystathionine beta-lyase n=1 Tax=Malassezia equina TaxID=1381935 RepID=A0AAF0J2H5_9BASI|nr:cysteine-S-conjugate beta-lyase [Malassezia equina]
MPADLRACSFATQCATVYDPSHADQYGASSVPVYLTATFKGLPGAEYDYSRVSNPTRSVLEHHLTQIQGCKHAFAVSCGMACLDVIMRFVGPGEYVLAGDDLYGGSNRLLDLLRQQMHIQVLNVDTTDPVAVEQALVHRATEHAAGRGARIALVLLESPTNPMIKIADLPRCVQLARKHAPDALTVVDNTMMSPFLMRPLDMGVDIVYDSATKYLSGHHDVMAGVIACNRDDLAAKMFFTIKSVGNGLAPLECFLLLRGIKTLALRMEKQQATTMRIAQYLEQLGFKVRYPGLRSYPGYAVHARQARGAGGVLSFETGQTALSEKIVAAVRLWGVSVSFGCVNSLITMPCQMSHASIPPEVRAERGLPENLIRLCVGIEDADDLMADLQQALLHAGAIQPSKSLKSSYVRVPVEDEMETLRRAIAQRSATSSMEASAPTTLTVSAPGKVILLGEHAVVHGVKAMAAATSLRCYGHVQPSTDRLGLSMPDIELTHAWDASTLPWSLVTRTEAAPTELEPQLLAALSALVAKTWPQEDRRHAASLAFLYLYMHLAPPTMASQAFELRSALPISAGLGSSAAVSVCLASLLLYTHKHLALPAAQAPLPNEHARSINAWAFIAEKVIHGEPSGVDNTVATLGGAVAFTRAVEANGLAANELDPLRFDAVRLLITDTKVVRNTKELVARVRQQKEAEPERVNAALAMIQRLADEAHALLNDTTVPHATQVARLGLLLDLNHLQLMQLRVGHPALDQVREWASRYGAATKLTGAGGGGCAISLLPDEMSETALHELVKALHAQGFATYETEMGGPGVGVLVRPYDASAWPPLDAPIASWAETAGTWVYA